jgi:hypothetical protein
MKVATYEIQHNVTAREPLISCGMNKDFVHRMRVPTPFVPRCP